MTQYRRLAELKVENDSCMELWEVAEFLNGDMGEFKIMWVNPSTYYLVQEDEDGEVDVGAAFEELSGDVYGDTDTLAQDLEGEPYFVVEVPPDGTRYLAFIDDQ